MTNQTRNPNDEWRRLVSPGVTPTEAEGSRLGHCCLSFAFPQSATFSACSAVSALKRAACYRSPAARRGKSRMGGDGNASVPGISSEKVACPLFPPLFPLKRVPGISSEKVACPHFSSGTSRTTPWQAGGIPRGRDRQQDGGRVREPGNRPATARAVPVPGNPETGKKGRKAEGRKCLSPEITVSPEFIS